MGGPISRDRWFFFADYEGTRITEGITQVTNVPTAAERAGDFSNSVLPAPINFFTGQPFPGNQVPSFFQNPIGQAIAGLYPLPNRNSPLANFVSSPNLEDRNDQFDVRIDRPAGGRLDLSARYSYSDRTLLEPFSGVGFSLVPGYGNTLDRRAQNLVASGVQRDHAASAERGALRLHARGQSGESRKARASASTARSACPSCRRTRAIGA